MAAAFTKNRINTQASSLLVFRILALVALLALLATHRIWAQEPQACYQGDDRFSGRISVDQVLQEEHHGNVADISGTVLRQIGPSSVLIHDGTAAVEVELPPDQIPKGGFKPNTRIRIRGEITHNEDDVHEVQACQLFWVF